MTNDYEAQLKLTATYKDNQLETRVESDGTYMHNLMMFNELFDYAMGEIAKRFGKSKDQFVQDCEHATLALQATKAKYGISED